MYAQAHTHTRSRSINNQLIVKDENIPINIISDTLDVITFQNNKNSSSGSSSNHKWPKLKHFSRQKHQAIVKIRNVRECRSKVAYLISIRAYSVCVYVFIFYINNTYSLLFFFNPSIAICALVTVPFFLFCHCEISHMNEYNANITPELWVQCLLF